jgi:glycosyltransferase involved in cell wall biosynthesis
MTQAIRRALDEEPYDVLHLEHLRGAELAHALHASDPPLVFDSVDSISLLFERAKKHAPRWQSRLLARLDLGRTRRYEAQFARRFAHILVTSPEDREALAALTGDSKPLVVLPNGVDLDYFAPLGKPRQPDTVVFSGKMSYHANTAAALDLVQKVMPGVWAERPETLVWLAGKDPPQVLRALSEDQRVIVTGTVPDLRPYLGRASVAVTPLRYGVGIQNKVLEAMAMATPVVTTPPTCRALQAEPGQHLLVGESAPELSQAILSLLADDGQREKLGQAGRRYIEEYHDWDRIAVQLEAVYQAAIDEQTA